MKKYIFGLSLLAMMSSAFTGCSDFFETESTRVIYDDEDHLVDANDTIYSVTGILSKLQKIGDRTVLLGEARGDLVTVTDYTSADLREVANFEISDDNIYNTPSDYYAVINNCNYFIANADTAFKNNRNEYIFKKEYAAVKAIRAWTYLQLVLAYGRVPLITEPILTLADTRKNYPMKDIQGICDYFLHEDGLQNMIDQEYPNYGTIKSLPSRLFFVPISLVLGDMYLWNQEYDLAAAAYYYYIANRNSSNYYPTTVNRVYWQDDDFYSGVDSWTSAFSDVSNASLSEIISLLPSDSVRSEGTYFTMRDIFNTSSSNDYKASLVPSQSLIDLSASQEYLLYRKVNNTEQLTYAPDNLTDYKQGDLRLSRAWYNEENMINDNGDRYTYQNIRKYSISGIRTYRRTLVYLRLAEALNAAGYPKFAYHFLSTGVNNKLLQDSIIPCYRADSAWLSNFNFPTTTYVLQDLFNDQTGNTMGIHSRGSGYTPKNQYYTMPMDTLITDSLALIAWQQEKVEDMIMDEEALEFAFEGYRFYDLMRVALRRNDPAYLANKIQARNGAESGSAVTTDLTDVSNWYLHWKGQIGY